MRLGRGCRVGLALLLVASILAGTPAPGTLPSPRRAHAAGSGLPPVADLPTAIVAGRDGALWFTEAGAGRIGRITVAGAVREFAIPTPRSGPAGIAAGPDGAIWFTEAYGDALGRLDPATGRIAEYPLPDLYGQPGRLAVGGDGALYFAQNDRGSVGRFTLSTGRFAQFGISTGLVNDLVRGPDGAIWLAEGKVGPPTIGRLGPDGSIAIYHDGGDFGDADVTAIAAGPDGALWFAPTGTGMLGRLTTAGTFSKVRVQGGAALALAAGPDRALWFASSDGGVGRLPARGAPALFPLGDHVLQAPAVGIVAGPDGNLWCTLAYIDSIARLTPSGDVAWFALPSAPPRAFDLATAADGSAWATLPEQNRIAHVTAAGAVRIFRPLTHDSEPAAIVPAPDRSAWFSEYRARRLARVTAGGAVREYPLPPQSPHPFAVAVAPNGMVWWTRYPVGLLARLDPASGRITDYPGTIGTDPDSIAAGADGRIWLSDPLTGAIDRFDPASGHWASFPVPLPRAHPYAIAAAPGGGVIFLLDGARPDRTGRHRRPGHPPAGGERYPHPRRRGHPRRRLLHRRHPDHIGRVGADSAVTYLQVPTANSDPQGIIAAPDGSVWFIEFSAGQLARIDPASGAIREYPLVTTH